MKRTGKERIRKGGQNKIIRREKQINKQREQKSDRKKQKRVAAKNGFTEKVKNLGNGNC